MYILDIVSLNQCIIQEWFKLTRKSGNAGMFYVDLQNSLSLSLAYTSLIWLGLSPWSQDFTLSYFHLNMGPEVFTVLYHDLVSIPAPNPIPALSATLCLLSALAAYRRQEHSTASITWHAGKRQNSTGCWQITDTEFQLLGKDIRSNHMVCQIFSRSGQCMENQRSPGNRPVTILEVQGGGGCQRASMS